MHNGDLDSGILDKMQVYLNEKNSFAQNLSFRLIRNFWISIKIWISIKYEIIY